VKISKRPNQLQTFEGASDALRRPTKRAVNLALNAAMKKTCFGKSKLVRSPLTKHHILCSNLRKYRSAFGTPEGGIALL
jgi:hypothetical protein